MPVHKKTNPQNAGSGNPVWQHSRHHAVPCGTPPTYDRPHGPYVLQLTINI
jgi:hypothetical protein